MTITMSKAIYVSIEAINDDDDDEYDITLWPQLGYMTSRERRSILYIVNTIRQHATINDVAKSLSTRQKRYIKIKIHICVIIVSL